MKKKLGLRVALAILLLACLAIAAYRLATMGRITGTFLDSAFVPGEDGKALLWVLSEESIPITWSDETPGHYSSGTLDLFGKTWLCLYDPARKKLVKKIMRARARLPHDIRLFAAKDRLWEFSLPFEEAEADIRAFDPRDGALISDLRGLKEAHPELGAGIAEMYYLEDPVRLSILTGDGRRLAFDPSADKIYGDEAEFESSARTPPGQASLFALGPLKSEEGERKRLFLASGKDAERPGADLNDFHPEGGDARPLLPDRVFLSGKILYQDGELCLVFHQSRLGKEAERCLSCVGADGRESWTLTTANGLFPSLRLREGDGLSAMPFILGDLRADRSGDLVVFEWAGKGLLGISRDTGRILFRI